MCTKDEIKEKLVELKVQNAHFYKKLKTETILLNELIRVYGDLPIRELFHCGMNKIHPPICKYGNKLKYSKSKKDYITKCDETMCMCYRELVSLRTSSPNVQNKMKKTCMDIYGVENASQNKNIRKKIEKTNLKRYGATNPATTDVVKNKIKQTNLKKYGVESYTQTEEYKEKTKQTNLERYGVDNPMKNLVVQKKSKQTNLERYGVESYAQTEECKEKTKQTSLKRYGVENISQNCTIKEAKKITTLMNNGVEFPMQSEQVKNKSRKTTSKRFYDNLNTRVMNCIPLFNLEDYNGTTENDLALFYQWKCKTCNTEFNDHIDDGRIPRCPTCYPNNQSKWELEIQEYINQYIDIETNTKQIIKPYELDIYIPSKKLAIECNGAYWHSEEKGKDETYHLNKTERCEAQGIQLLHIWDYEYNANPNLIKSIIKSKLDLNENICASKTNIQMVDDELAIMFLEQNHIQGICATKINLGLFCENELVALMIFNTNEKYELIRYCSKQNINIIGGTNKLFNYFIEKYNPKTVIGYANRRYSTSTTPKQLGFKFIENSSPDFKYTKDYKNFYNITEMQNNDNNEYVKLWDCGNSIWEWNKNE